MATKKYKSDTPLKCKRCGGNKLHKRAKRNGKQRIQCIDCKAWDTTIFTQTIDSVRQPKILCFDIETSPMEVYVWGLMRNDFITPDKVIKDWNVISWSAKWLGDSKIMSAVQTKKEAIARDDKRITKKLWSLFDEAEILIAHNGRRFDIKKINTRFYMNDMGVPSSYLVIDTLIEARKNFAFSSNKLDYLGELMISKKKLSTDFQLWKDCLAGNVEQLKRMQAYNDMDVRLLEEVYLEMRPWMKSHPNIALMLNGKGDSCPTCASTDIKENGAYYTTQANQYVSYRCNNCGAISRSMQGEIPLSNRKRLIRTVAR